MFNPKPKKNAPDEISYCQHAALEWQFLQVDGQWLCALTPTYHYTRDGHRDSLYMSELLTGIKQRERNPAVYHLTRMWAAYLPSAVIRVASASSERNRSRSQTPIAA